VGGGWFSEDPPIGLFFALTGTFAIF